MTPHDWWNIITRDRKKFKLFQCTSNLENTFVQNPLIENDYKHSKVITSMIKISSNVIINDCKQPELIENDQIWLQKSMQSEEIKMIIYDHYRPLQSRTIPHPIFILNDHVQS